MNDKTRANDPKDWSTRHVRLRFELVACALVVFLFAQYNGKLQPSILFPVKLDEVPPNHAIAGLSFLYLYLLVHFIIRTLAEYASVSDYREQTEEMIKKISSEREELRNTARNYDFTSLKGNVEQWLDNFSDTRDPGIISGTEENFKSIIRIIDKNREFILGSIHDANMSSNSMQLENFKHNTDRYEEGLINLKSYLETYQTDGENLEERLGSIRKNIRGEFLSFQSWFEKGHAERVEELNIKLTGIIESLGRQRRDFRIGRGVIGADRMLFSAAVPLIVSLGMMLVSSASVGQAIATISRDLFLNLPN